jgi:hypothetical protein
MATYKVIQDVEAEDKFLGPLTFKQFLFAGAACILGYIMFLFATAGLILLSVPILPIFLGLVALTIPWSKDQPTELFLASRIRFLFMKRKRIWDQSGVKDLVQITVPKKEAHIYSDGLSQDQVRDRLSALSDVVDSRGWVVKNLSSQPSSDRLVTAPQPMQVVEVVDAQKTEDMLDERSSESTHFDTMIQKSEDEHRKQTLDLVAQARAKSKQMNKSVLNEPEQQPAAIKAPQAAESYAAPASQPQKVVVSDPVLDSVSLPKVDQSFASMQAAPVAVKRPTVTKDEESALLEKVHQRQQTEAQMEQHSHMKIIQPLSVQAAQAQAQAQAQVLAEQAAKDDAQASIQPPIDPVILSLAQNDDRSVESLAREASKKDLSDGEVVISLR